MRLKEEAFRACTTAKERAETDADLFSEYYFLTDGKPDHSKTKALALDALTNEAMKKLLAVTNRIHGLNGSLIPHDSTWRNGLYQATIYTVVLGWDRAACSALRKEIEWKLKEGEEEKKRDDVMEKHSELVKQAKESKGKKPMFYGPGQIGKCIGSYVVRSDSLDREYGNDPLTIDIHLGPTPTILVAAVDWGHIEGTMLLAFSEKDLDDYIGATKAKRKKSQYDDDEEEDDEDDEDEEDEDEDDEYDYDNTASKTSNKRKAPAPKPKRGRPTKKSKVETPKFKRLHYRLKGRETGENEMFYVPYKGYFDFTDDTCTAFKGKADIPYITSNADIEGFKVNARPQNKAEAWSSFSAAAYERERVARWH